ncbi:membrane protein [Burkholderia contaminans]|nr:membrane protein [Burkholderia contaminans]
MGACSGRRIRSYCRRRTDERRPGSCRVQLRSLAALLSRKLVTYIPLLMKITLDIDQPNRQLASNTFDISANPVLASVLLAFRF